MPRATHVPGETERFELESCPPDGFVELRRLSYGEKLERREMTMAMYTSGDRRDNRISFDLLMQKVQLFDFKNCIVNHNLEDDRGEQLDFRKMQDVLRLDDRIAEEIEEKINIINGRQSALEEEQNLAEQPVGDGDNPNLSSSKSGNVSTDDERHQKS